MLRPGGAAAVARRLAARSAALAALQAIAKTVVHYCLCVLIGARLISAAIPLGSYDSTA